MISNDRLQSIYTYIMLIAGGALMFLIITSTLTEGVMPWQTISGEFSYNQLCLFVIAIASLINGWRRWTPKYV